ncbi:MAG: hypothetical protein JSU70_05835 [Phycisphaerales bacterium]|nr:MAG: hypothetical protein JSU70_05835 [Phycisphaerales bacterium]
MQSNVASLSFTIVLLLCSAAFAGLDQFQETKTGGAMYGEGDFWAQTFTAGLEGILDRVDLGMYVADNSIPTTVEIRTTAGGVPTDTILGSVLVPASVLKTGLGWRSIDLLPLEIASTPGTMYAIVIWNTDPSPEGTNAISLNWGSDGVDLYTRGSVWKSLFGVDHWSQYAYGPADLQFRTYVRPSMTCTDYPVADFNKDCRVDSADLAIFLDGWLECNLDPPEDCWDYRKPWPRIASGE